MHKDSEQPKNHTASRSFLDYFRCPEEFATFHVLTQQPESRGFFRFGSATCYGDLHRHGASISPKGIEVDAMPSLESLSSGNAGMHFDPDDVVKNLRFERYVTRGDRELEDATGQTARAARGFILSASLYFA